ncbi:hypothetical protein F383_16173 [Gossypium arboreum]|nr:hypothetical protein F383_16173 [Gossypium arboreum]
MNRRNS